MKIEKNKLQPLRPRSLAGRGSLTAGAPTMIVVCFEDACFWSPSPHFRAPVTSLAVSVWYKKECNLLP